MSQLNRELKAEVMHGSGISSIQNSMPPVSKGPVSQSDLFWYVPVPGQIGNIHTSRNFTASHSRFPIPNQKEASFRRIMVRSF